jgi:hypothetical protein
MVFVPFERVELFADAAFKRPVDLQQPIAQFFASKKEIFYVRVPSISVHFRMITKRKEWQQHAPLSGRVFDLKWKFLKILNKPLEFWSKIQLFIGP